MTPTPSELVAKLRDHASTFDRPNSPTAKICEQAADCIERLSEDYEEFKKELEMRDMSDGNCSRNACNSIRKSLSDMRGELTNFLACFDRYFDYRGLGSKPPQQVHDAKEAMFSAAIQARKALAEDGT